MSDANNLAAAFRGIIGQWLTAEQLVEIDVRNQSEPDWPNTRICHSHDFCDANQAMLNALTDTGLSYDEALVNEAWSIAKRQGFCG